MTKKLLMGNEAFAHAALEAGVNVVAGYPGTPSSELVETVAKLRAHSKAHGVQVQWSTNEKAALELLAGASLSGARTLFTCKQVGLNVASDALLSLNYIGVRGGFVLFVADDPGPISSQTEQDTRRFASFAKVPVLDPQTPEEGFEMLKEAFEISEAYKTPVIVRPTTRICHASTFFNVEDETFAQNVLEGGFEKSSRWVIFPKRAFEAHEEINVRLKSIAHNFSHEQSVARFNHTLHGGGTSSSNNSAKFGIVAGGVSAAYTQDALELMKQRVKEAGVSVPAWRLWQVGTPYPFPSEACAKFCEGLEKVIVFEELDCVLEDELLKFAGQSHANFEVYGKLNDYAPTRGENSIDAIYECLCKFFSLNALENCATAYNYSPMTEDSALPARPPVLCPGCPHRGSFYAVKQALCGEEAVMCGDIGCYTLGNAAPLNAVDTCLCMGAGITMAQGIALANENKKAVAFVGDSTFFASGITGIVNAVYNNINMTLCVLDNSTTAMTGGQPHPGTGITLEGNKNPAISIDAVLKAVGVKCVVHANPLNLNNAVKQAKQAINFEGPSAILFESPCAKIIKQASAVKIDSEVCTGCKKCINEIGCPAIGFNASLRGKKSGMRGQAYVDAAQCTGCGLCVSICPFSAIVKGV